jgi:hypothetical protein
MFYKADVYPQAEVHQYHVTQLKVMLIVVLMSIDVSNSFNSLGSYLQSHVAPLK